MKWMWSVIYFYTYFWHRAKEFLNIHYTKHILLYTTKCNFIHMSDHWWAASEPLGKITGHIQLHRKSEKDNVIKKDKDVGEYS